MKKVYVFLLIIGTFLSNYTKHETKQEPIIPTITPIATTPETSSTTLTKKEKRKLLAAQKKAEEQADLEKKQQLIDMPQYTLASSNLETLPTLIIKKQKDAEYKKLNLLFTRIEFTHEGISSFFHHTLNRREYGTDLLPHNFTHFVQFMVYAKEARQSPEFVESVIRLFTQKIKTSPYISAPAFERLLTQSQLYLEYHLAQKEMSFITELKSCLIAFFKNRFTQLQEQPLAFFDELSQDLNQKIHANISSPDRARFTLIRFLTSALDKVVWSPDDQIKTWESCKKMGSIINQLHANKVIPDPLDANDLYWSLVERYCYFMEIVGTKLTMETCAAIKRDITNQEAPWLMTPEQEEGIETKTERLVTVLLETEMSIKAAKQGIFSEKAMIA